MTKEKKPCGCGDPKCFDIPELTEEDFARARPKRGYVPPKDRNKEPDKIKI